MKTKEEILKEAIEILPYEITGNICPFCKKECPKWGHRTRKETKERIQTYYCDKCDYRFDNKIWKGVRRKLKEFYQKAITLTSQEKDKEFSEKIEKLKSWIKMKLPIKPELMIEDLNKFTRVITKDNLNRILKKNEKS